MVQRKVSNKLGIQADHVKSERRLANLKPSSCQYQDGKNRGPDMKKKMKRSRSIKLSDMESLRSSSSSLKQTTSQPGKPPPLDIATPQKQQTPVRTNYGSPNYMKGTSSSEARKESSQVSSRRSSSNSKSKHGSGSSNKSAKSLTKASSLKLVRTLTKTPSFKPVRAGSKKCSRVFLCADVNAQRATCSSTLKDSKFPDYLVLNPGGTEVEGTSVKKVCPYTYCSLNGHHHKPLLPLKCFLSARRRMMKIQKSMKLEALSPRRVKPVGEGDLDSSPLSPLTQEGGMDFFIKIYAKSKEENSESIHGDCHEAEVEHSNGEQIAKDMSTGSQCSEIYFEENLELDSAITSLGADIMEGFPEEEKLEDPDKDYPAIAAQTEGVSDFEDESNGSSEDNGSISEVSDMEWEEGQFPTLEIDTEADDAMKDDNESDFDDVYLSEFNNNDLPGEPITKYLEIFESSQVSDSDQDSASKEAEADFDGVAITSAWTEDSIVKPKTSFEEIEEKTKVPEAENEIPGIGPQVGDDDNYYTIEVTDETLNNQQDKSLQDSDLITMWLQNQTSNSFQDSDKGEQVVTEEDYKGSQETEDSKRVQTDEGDQVAISEFDVELQEIPNNEAGCQMEEKEQDAVTKRSIGVQVPDDLYEPFLNDGKVDDSAENQEYPSEGVYYGTDVAVNHYIAKNDEVKEFVITSSLDSKEESDSGMYKMEVEESIQSETALESTSLPLESKSKQELPSSCSNKKWTIGSKRPATNEEEMRNFNPREPNFLPVVPDPDAEKVDLKHQITDERKNSEEWMVDYALRQAVTKLAPARKRKVALLVEAFETVIPVPKYETHLRHSSPAFAPARPMQACS